MDPVVKMDMIDRIVDIVSRIRTYINTDSVIAEFKEDMLSTTDERLLRYYTYWTQQELEYQASR